MAPIFFHVQSLAVSRVVKILALSAFLLIFHLQAFSQTSCCPTAGQCSSCLGGVVHIELRYNGVNSTNVLIKDVLLTIFSGSVNPGDIITLEGSLYGLRFIGDQLTVTLNGSQQPSVPVICSGTIYKNAVFGYFSVENALSQFGGTLCCSSSQTDTTAPVISNCPTDIEVILGTNECSKNIEWTAPTATDCNLASFTSSKSPGSNFSSGTTLVTYTAKDMAGNTSTCSFNVTVKDVTAPVISGCMNDVIVSAQADCLATANWLAPTSTDNCGASTMTSSYSPGDIFPIGTTEVTYTATDAFGNSSYCKFNVIVKDDTAPVFTGCIQDIVADASCQNNIYWQAPQVTDNCSTPDVSSTHSPGDIFSIGTTQVKYTAKDAAGNTSTCTFNVILNDISVPAFTGCPSEIVAFADNNGKAIVQWTEPGATDNCQALILSSNYSSGDIFNLGTTRVVYTAVDDYGNSGECSFNVVVKDNIAPIISNCPSSINVYVDASCNAQVSWQALTAVDNSGSFEITSTHRPGDIFNIGTTTVKYTVTDPSGNSSTCSFNVITADNIVPEIICPQNIETFADENGTAIASWNEPSVSDNCGVLSVINSHNSGDAFPIGTTTVTYTVTDNSSNKTNCSFDIIVRDNTKPVFQNCVSDITVEAEATCQSMVNWSSPTATDNSGSLILNQTHNPGDYFSVGTTPVIYTVKDEAGNIAICSFNIIVLDKIEPVVSNCPDDIIVEVADACERVVTWTEPQFTDPCSEVSLMQSHHPGDLFPIGSTEVTYTAKDVAGNTTQCIFHVIVMNNNPILLSCLEDVFINANENCMAKAEWQAPHAEKLCGAVSLTSSHAPGDLFPLGTTEVVYTARDDDGNSVSCSFNVVVTDALPPSITSCPTDILIDANANCEANAYWSLPVANDNCSVTSFIGSSNSGDTFSIGKTEVNYTAKDAAGNTATCKFIVEVVDRSAPVFSVCPATVTVSANEHCEAVAQWNIPVAIDQCTDVTLISSHQPGDTFSIGTTQVTYAATDGYGNTSYCSFSVNVESNQLPVIEGCSEDIAAIADETGEVEVDWSEPTASITCGNVALTSNYHSGQIFKVGKTEVEYKATDDFGHSTSCKFNVVVAYEEIKIEVTKLVTPDGDGINDLWEIGNIAKYKSNKVLLVDRWGGEIYSAQSYDNDVVVWNGKGPGGAIVPTGTYFYSIMIWMGPAVVEKKGFIEVIK